MLPTSGCCFQGPIIACWLRGEWVGTAESGDHRALGAMISPPVVCISWASKRSSNEGLQGAAWVMGPHCEPHLF